MKINWHIETRKITALKEWEKNPRLLTKKGMEDLTRSIDSFGLAEPIVINVEGTVIGGHARLKVLQQRNETECDCYVPDRQLTDKEVEELNIRLNADIAGGFDWDVLANEWDVKELTAWGLEVYWKGTDVNNLTDDNLDINEQFDPFGTSKELQRVVFIFDDKNEAESYLNNNGIKFIKRSMAWQVNMSTQSI